MIGRLHFLPYLKPLLMCQAYIALSFHGVSLMFGPYFGSKPHHFPQNFLGHDIDQHRENQSILRSLPRMVKLHASTRTFIGQAFKLLSDWTRGQTRLPGSHG